MKETIVDGVKITEYDNGTTHFEPVKEDKPQERSEPDGFFAKIWNWFKNSDSKPYIKVRDLADPFEDRKNDPDDIDAGSDGKQCVEIGWKWTF